MKINYYSNSKGEKVTKDVTGKEDEIPSIYFSMFVGDHFGNGTGWIELPEALIQSIRQNHQVEIKGFVDSSKAPLPKMDAKGNVTTTLPATGNGGFIITDDAVKKAQYTTPTPYPQPKSNPFIQDEFGKNDRLANYIQGEQTKPYTIIDQQLLEEMKAHAREYAKHFDADKYILEGLDTKTIEEAAAKLNSELIKRNSTKAYIKTDGSINTFAGRTKALEMLGFVKRSADRWYHHILGEDREQNWLAYDPTTQPFSIITTMLFKTGFVRGQFKVRMDFKKALDL